MKLKELTDVQLVEQYLAGNSRCFDVLLNRHKRRLFTYIYLMVKKRDLAEDIFQDTFIKIINSLKNGKYNDDGKFIAWATRIAHNLIIDHFRKEQNLKTVSNDSYEADLFNSIPLADKPVEASIISQQINSDLRKLIEYLPSEQKEIILMRHYIGMSFKEIAEETNVSINTALGRMRYALINLRRIIEEKKIQLTEA
ncbi:MAG: RNA polymerase subunit sigma-24 [Bacteroidetes bacterium HGW-Bacteroidetes-21]|jgi:RNA polymerase sigma-70 factor (ECF subfamily)|nr:MAG: RNA polymerase subunit sigma-24 [Bacteroidetes bacterium HGW-Bacteroidetes-21]